MLRYLFPANSTISYFFIERREIYFHIIVNYEQLVRLFKYQCYTFGKNFSITIIPSYALINFIAHTGSNNEHSLDYVFLIDFSKAIERFVHLDETRPKTSVIFIIFTCCLIHLLLALLLQSIYLKWGIIWTLTRVIVVPW